METDFFVIETFPLEFDIGRSWSLRICLSACVRACACARVRVRVSACDESGDRGDKEN